MTVIAAQQDEAGALQVTGAGGVLLAALTPNKWETGFFGRNMGRLAITAAADALPAPQWHQATALIAAAADAYRLVQTHLDVHHLGLAPALEQAGFRLVDTRISFVTRLDRRRLDSPRPPAGEVRLAAPQDLPQLLALTRRRLTENPRFYSRYKNRDYFTPEDSERWFAAWIENDLADPRSRVAVWEVGGSVAGFFCYQRLGEREGLPFYKSTVAAVEEARSGQKAHLFLQTFLFDGMPTDEFWVEGTTQLTNSPIIHNNLAAGRRLDRVELTFFRTPPG